MGSARQENWEIGPEKNNRPIKTCMWDDYFFLGHLFNLLAFIGIHEYLELLSFLQSIWHMSLNKKFLLYYCISGAMN